MVHNENTVVTFLTTRSGYLSTHPASESYFENTVDILIIFWNTQPIHGSILLGFRMLLTSPHVNEIFPSLYKRIIPSHELHSTHLMKEPNRKIDPLQCMQQNLQRFSFKFNGHTLKKMPHSPFRFISSSEGRGSGILNFLRVGSLETLFDLTL